MKNNEHWLKKIKNKVVGMTVVPEKSIENSLQTPEKKIDKTEEIIEVIKKAEETLYKNNNPLYEETLAKPLIKSPSETIRVIKDRGWRKRGNAEEANCFLIRVLSRILNEGEGMIKEKALDVLVQIFTTPDDNTTGWVCILEQSANVIAKANVSDAKGKLESLKSEVSGNNVKAIDYALSLLQD
ncbi:hypothetical protein [uncultured Desulfobacter sp.]|jgi:sulfatase maturation enzyme AslB (radical SAM superfamily)|uniref:hypothetical protein n=1 Tax=uncultured Desulfobacter sp. TaxID=240139 RepID=UPI0029C79582|nr:hypothetical protein [uncultured Desulfobacter sp.]